MHDIVLTRDIAAGEFFIYTAPRPTDRVLIVGNIAAGADVTITAAQCELRGSVAANCRVTFEAPQAAGTKASFNVLSGPCEGLIIDGAVGDNVVLAANTGIRVRGAIGPRLLADAGGDFRANMLGDFAQVRAGRDIAVTGIGAKSRLRAGGRAGVTYVGAGARVSARQIVAPKASALPYNDPQASHDICIGARATNIYNGRGTARLRRMS